jgi:hypothetical protein
MKPWGPATLLLVCLTSGATIVAFGIPCVVSATRLRVPRVSTSQPEAKLGVVRPGARISRSFEIANSGSVALTLGEPRVTCRCIAPVLSENVVQPGARLKIELVLKEREQTGPFRERVDIPTNDPATPIVRFSISGQIRPAVSCLPQHVFLGPVRPGGRVSKTVELMTYDSAPFSVTDAQYDKELFSVDYVEIGSGQSYRATLAFHPLRGPRAVLNREVLFKIRHPELDTIRVPVTAEVSDEVVAIPPRLLALIGSASQVLTREVTIEGPAEPPEITSVVCTDRTWTLVSWRAHRDSTSRGTLLTVELRLPSTQGLSKGSLVVSCKSTHDEDNISLMARPKSSAPLALTRTWQMMFLHGHVPRTVLDL